MNTQEFNNQYQIDTSAKRGLKAKAKGSAGFSEALTADGLPFCEGQIYYFFDAGARSVRSSDGMRRQDSDWISAMGFKVVQIDKLRAAKSDALTDGQKHFRGLIVELETLILKFETQKAEK